MQGNCWGAGGTTCPVYGISLALGVGLGIWVPTRKAGRGLFSLSVQSSRQRFLDDSKRDPADGLPPVKLIVHWVKVTCPDEAEASKQTCKEEKLLYIPKQTINRGPCSSQKGEMNNSRFFNLLFFFFSLWSVFGYPDKMEKDGNIKGGQFGWKYICKFSSSG